MSKQFWEKCPKSPCHPSSPLVEIDGVLCCSHVGCYEPIDLVVVPKVGPVPVPSFYDPKEIEPDEDRSRPGYRESGELPDE